MHTVTAVDMTPHGLQVHLGESTTTLGWRWLRDHGEDEVSFDAATKQRRVYALDAARPRPALRARLASFDNTSVVAITWPEAPEQTWISVATLSALLSPAPVRSPTLWHRPQDVAVNAVDVEAVLADPGALRSWLEDIDRTGFGLLTGFDGGHDEVTALASRIGRPMSTIFGTTWDLASDVETHEDTAYTQNFLAPHTDGTYMHHAPGLQMFCCIERDGAGGESIIVDSFAIADTLRTEQPEHFETLVRVKVPGHYLEDGVELRASRPAIRLDQDGAVVQVSMNNYDRSPMLLDTAEMDEFYAAYGALHDLANDEARWKSIRLEAGDVLINDNWRVLHGRQAYTGSRRFVGCYIDHGDFESRLRTTAPRTRES